MTDPRLGLKAVVFGFHISFLGYAVDLPTLLFAGVLVSLSGFLHPIRA